MKHASPDVVVVLPPRESFSPNGAGSVALLVHQAARAPSRYRRLVVGPRCAAAFDDVAFVPAWVRPWLGSGDRRYAAAVSRRIGDPPLIEVHNRAGVAMHLARMRPDARVSLFLHNDPQTMRGLRLSSERAEAGARLAGFVCVSDYLASRLADSTSIVPTVIPNSIDLSCLPPPPPTRDKLILFVGRLVADKGADHFVTACGQALPNLPGWRAEMIGADRFAADSPITPFVAALMRQATAAGVILSGYQPQDQVLAAMARAAIVVVPSRWQEPFGMTALEAMASGAALICSGRGGLADVVGDVAISCDPDSPGSIAAAIRRLARDPAARTARGAAGTARAATFDVTQAAARLDAYRDRLMPAHA